MKKMRNFRYTPRRVLNGLAYRAKTIFLGIASQFVSFYFGNTAGLKFNVGAAKELLEFRKTFSGMAFAADSAAKAISLQENGYVLLGRVSPMALVERVVDTVKSGFDSNGVGTVSSPNGASQFFLSPVDTVPGLPELLDESICRLISSYYKTAIQVKTVRVWRNHHVAGIDSERADLFSNTFHHDNCKVTGLRIFILLKDGVDKNSGALRFHDRKASEGIIRSFGYFHRFMQSPGMIRRLTDPKTLRYFSGNRGDVAIVNTQQCLHAASVPKELGSYRDILQFEVYPAPGAYKAGTELLNSLPEDTDVLSMRFMIDPAPRR